MKAASLLEKLILKNKANTSTACQILNEFPAERRGAILMQIPNESIKILLFMGYVLHFNFCEIYEKSTDESVKQFILKALIFNRGLDEARISAEIEKLIPYWSISIDDLRDSDKDKLSAVDENGDMELNTDEIIKIKDDKAVGVLFKDIIKKTGLDYLTFDILCKILNKFPAERRLIILFSMINEEIFTIFASMYPVLYYNEYKEACDKTPDDVKKAIADALYGRFNTGPSPEYQYEAPPLAPPELGIIANLVKNSTINSDNYEYINSTIMVANNCELRFAPAQDNNIALGYTYEQDGYKESVYYIFKTNTYMTCREPKKSGSQPIWRWAKASEIKLFYSKVKSDYRKLEKIMQQYRR